MNADPEIVDQVVDFYQDLYNQVFAVPFGEQLKKNRLRRDAVRRQVEEAANASSQSLTRFFVNQRLTEEHVTRILDGWASLPAKLRLADISNPNVSPEEVVERLLGEIGCPAAVTSNGHEPIYRVGLHSLIQVLMLVGPVMAEWQKLSFASTFELPRRVVQRLNQISEQLAIGVSGQETVDERYELLYRDHLLQRFHRVEAGTVRMTTNMDVDLRELFVMPRVRPRPTETAGGAEACGNLMKLAEARRFFEGPRPESKQGEAPAASVLDEVRNQGRMVIVGAPGSGKSSFLEWLQLRLASAELEMPLSGAQAIPLLLRVRQIDPKNLPRGSSLVEKATASKDRAALMPAGWLDRQMRAGRVLFMLDGLDETEPELRARHIIPWLAELCREYPTCRYLLSSRPVGHAAGTLGELGFVECDLLDFDDESIREYTRHWCTAVRLAHNEPEEEARRAGKEEGEAIASGFEGHAYIRDLARNPLMLSAICLVSYFERGQLPKDRAVLYKLCAEGLLHYWDQRRGIHAEFSLQEKLRTCREIAVAMQASDRAEYETDDVLNTTQLVLGDAARAKQLIEHIRYRTGLLLERRPGVFAFAHLTFQEYLAALAVLEGNNVGVNAEKLVREHDDGRWREVIALFCGMAPSQVARETLQSLINRSSPSDILADAYWSSNKEITDDPDLRDTLIRQLAVSTTRGPKIALERFTNADVAPIANATIGYATNSTNKIPVDYWDFSHSYRWLRDHPEHADLGQLVKRLQEWRDLSPLGLSELVYLTHRIVPIHLLVCPLDFSQLYSLPGFVNACPNQGYIGLLALAHNEHAVNERHPQLDKLILHMLRTFVVEISTNFVLSSRDRDRLKLFFRELGTTILAGAERNELVSLADLLATNTFLGTDVASSLARWAGLVDTSDDESHSGKIGEVRQ
jgi:NACHT domain